MSDSRSEFEALQRRNAELDAEWAALKARFEPLLSTEFQLPESATGLLQDRGPRLAVVPASALGMRA